MPSIYDDPFAEEPELFDSGFTTEEIDAIVGEFMDETTTMEHGPRGLFLGIALGLGGDVVALSERGTVMLPEPRATIDARLAKARELRASGLTTLQVLDRLD